MGPIEGPAVMRNAVVITESLAELKAHLREALQQGCPGEIRDARLRLAVALDRAAA